MSTRLLRAYGNPRYNSAPRDGEVVCHNHVKHNPRSRNGWNGFRWWSCAKPPANFELCNCGWRPDLGPHYAMSFEERLQ